MTELNMDPLNMLAVASAYLDHFARETMLHLEQPHLFERVAEVLGTSSDPVPAVNTVVPAVTGVAAQVKVPDFAAC